MNMEMCGRQCRNGGKEKRIKGTGRDKRARDNGVMGSSYSLCCA